MKRIDDNIVDAFFLYEGKLVELFGYVNKKLLFLRHVRDIDKPKCPKCGEILYEHDQFDVVEESLNFQSGAEKINTLTNE